MCVCVCVTHWHYIRPEFPQRLLRRCCQRLNQLLVLYTHTHTHIHTHRAHMKASTNHKLQRSCHVQQVSFCCRSLPRNPTACQPPIAYLWELRGDQCRAAEETARTCTASCPELSQDHALQSLFQPTDTLPQSHTHLHSQLLRAVTGPRSAHVRCIEHSPLHDPHHRAPHHPPPRRVEGGWPRAQHQHVCAAVF